MTEIKFNRAKLVDGKLSRETVAVKEITITEAGFDGEFIWLRLVLENGETHDTPYFKGTS